MRCMYVMFDRVSLSFGDPFCMNNDAEVTRHFENCVLRNPDVPEFVVHDTNILRIGHFVDDPSSPSLVPENPYVVLLGANYDVKCYRASESDPPVSAF